MDRSFGFGLAWVILEAVFFYHQFAAYPIAKGWYQLFTGYGICLLLNAAWWFLVTVPAQKLNNSFVKLKNRH